MVFFFLDCIALAVDESEAEIQRIREKNRGGVYINTGILSTRKGVRKFLYIFFFHFLFKGNIKYNPTRVSLALKHKTHPLLVYTMWYWGSPSALSTNILFTSGPTRASSHRGFLYFSFVLL